MLAFARRAFATNSAPRRMMDDDAASTPESDSVVVGAGDLISLLSRSYAQAQVVRQQSLKLELVRRHVLAKGLKYCTGSGHDLGGSELVKALSEGRVWVERDFEGANEEEIWSYGRGEQCAENNVALSDGARCPLIVVPGPVSPPAHDPRACRPLRKRPPNSWCRAQPRELGQAVRRHHQADEGRLRPFSHPVDAGAGPRAQAVARCLDVDDGAEPHAQGCAAEEWEGC